MRTTPALRTLAVALLTGGSLIAGTAGATAAVAAPPTYADGDGSGRHGDPVRGTVVSHTKLNVRQAPTSHAPAVASLSPGSQDRVDCAVRGQSVNGNPYWYWLVGAQGWASAAFVDTDGHWVPKCADPCPEWKDGSWTNWDEPKTDSSWSVSASGSWSFSASGTSSSGWSLLGGW
ncbi:SH3 domain-containing protein [Streptomyces sp. NPDC058867]|uniref:SH3 domain-containing protein n=1 Tax=unclassified Streptomyces TaxID=2593676 RepID=UPI00369BD2E3